MAESTEAIKKQYEQGRIDLKGCYKHLSDFERHKLQDLWEQILARADIDIDKVTGSNDCLITPVLINIDEKDLNTSSTKQRGEVFNKCKYGETVQDKVEGTLIPTPFESTLTGNTLESHLWESAREDVPDTLILRFLRARKWDVSNALDMLLTSVKWRHLEGVEEIIYHGESLNEASLMYKGTSYLHGLDKLKYPIVWSPSKFHFQKDQSFSQMKRYLVLIMETARQMLRYPHEKVCLVMDMSNSTLSNMDRSFVKLFLKYLEAYYPECLAVTLVHAGPFWFSGVFKMISPWIDPTVAQKIQFTKNIAGLEQYIDIDQIPKAYRKSGSGNGSGSGSFEYKYILPKVGENDKMSDKEGKKAALEARNLVASELKQLTLDWIQAGKVARATGATEADKKAELDLHNRRDDCQERLAAAARQLDMYTRARNYYHRTGVLQSDGTVDWSVLQK